MIPKLDPLIYIIYIIYSIYIYLYLFILFILFIFIYIIYIDRGGNLYYGYCEAGFSSTGYQLPNGYPIFIVGIPGARNLKGIYNILILVESYSDENM